MTARLYVEGVDLKRLAMFLSRSLDGGSALGVVVGLTLLRDLVAGHLACSLLEAERIMDTMVARGFVVRTEGAGEPSMWSLQP